MAITKNLSFMIDPDAEEEYWETAEALKELAKRYRETAAAVKNATKQLLKFDELNRLTAPAEEKTSSGRSSSGSSSSRKTTSSGTTAKTAAEQPQTVRQKDTGGAKEWNLPLQLAFNDVLFNWKDLNWESIMMKLVAGLGMLAGGMVGFILGGPTGMVIGMTLGLSFGLVADSMIFNFDGELSKEELLKSILAVIPAFAGAALGLFLGGPIGAAIGLTLGMILSFTLLGLNWDEIKTGLKLFGQDLITNFDLHWGNLVRFAADSWNRLKQWWGGLKLGLFDIRLPHLQVQWEELAANSIITRVFGISAIPHLSVSWYARGGVVDGATIIGVGEQGAEAIVPLERNTEWIRRVALELKAQLEALAPESTLRLYPLPAAATGALIPPAALQPNPAADLDSLARTIAEAIAGIAPQQREEPEIRLYLDGKQISDVVTRYQRRNNRAYGN